MISFLVVAANVCNMDRIYDQANFTYSLPRPILESYLDGKAFDHKVSYTPDERSRLEEDVEAIYENILIEKPLQEQIAVITAGAPGAGKTVLMLQDQIRNKVRNKEFIYIDPDDVCLKNMENTYLKELGGSEDPLFRKAMYDKWRPGSNAACQLILANLIRENLAFYFGTTATSPGAAHLFNQLKTQKYKIRLLHITAGDDVRWGSIQERDKQFVQTTEEDIAAKGLLFPQRIQDTYLKYADRILFYFRDAVDENAVLAATWERIADGKDLGVLRIQDPNAYESIKTIHNTAVGSLGREDLLWEATVDAASIHALNVSLLELCPLAVDQL